MNSNSTDTEPVGWTDATTTLYPTESTGMRSRKKIVVIGYVWNGLYGN
jgi:hypothetical protein